MPKLNPAGTQLLAAIMAGADTKEAAYNRGMSLSYANRLARDAGLTRRLLTPDEWERVLLERSATMAGTVRLTRCATVRPSEADPT